MQGLSYRAFGPDDVEALHAIVSHWEVTSNLGSWPWPPDPEFTKNRCRPYGGEGFVWAILLDGRLVGSVAVTSGELGYMLHPDAQGQGLMTRAVNDALTHGFDVLKIAEIHADIWADNAISRRVLTRAGFQSVRRETVHALARNEPTASETFALSRARWRDLRGSSRKQDSPG